MRRRSGREVHGILLLDKPIEVTSNQALQRVKRLFKAAKAGHTGSLDPLATGMLPICLGAATKVCSYLLDARKGYRVTAFLGAATDSGDAHGSIVARTPAMELDSEVARRTLAGFRGESKQVPPMYSALKYKGKRLYDLARRGIEVARPARSIRIFSMELRRCEWPELEFDVTCSKGAYVRTLVEDVAKALGTLGYVSALRRKFVEPFEESQMVTLPALEATPIAGGSRCLRQIRESGYTSFACGRHCRMRCIRDRGGKPWTIPSTSRLSATCCSPASARLSRMRREAKTRQARSSWIRRGSAGCRAWTRCRRSRWPRHRAGAGTRNGDG